MQMKIGICDDDAAQRGYLGKLTEQWARQAGISASVQLFESAEAFWFCYQEDKAWHLLLLDIQMGEMDGVALAQHIRRDNLDVQMVFITGFSDFMAEGYEVSALHYLLKPLDEAKLFTVMNKACSAAVKESSGALVFSMNGESVRVLTDHILYVEAFAHSTVLATLQGPVETNWSISAMENRLEPHGFVRCHRSYLVALRHVRRIAKTCTVLDNGAEVPLSRSSYHKVNQAFIAYYRRMGE